jgi:DNA helicase-2/ATP-dependent DNA helicase PcrA
MAETQLNAPQLNQPQREAVLHAHGPLLVFAGAGSGKTRVITYRIANLLSTHGVPPYRILAVTFTNKAAGEMKERLVQLAGSELVGDLWVGTFHSICARLLRRYGDDVGLTRSFSIYDDSDQKAVMTRVLRDLKLDDRLYPPKVVLGRIHREKQEGRLPEEVELSGHFDEETQRAYAGYERALRAANAVDFDDLLLHVMRMVESPTSRAGEELRRRFDFVLVDEFQDTNRVQYRLVRALAARTNNLCVVGDDDQSIYSWRGADVLNIRGFERDFPGARVVKLEQNYRSTANIVAAAQGVIARAAGRAEKRLWTEQAAGSKVRVIALGDEREEAAYVVGKVRARLAEGTDPGQLAVLYRINAQSRVLEEAFRSANVPYEVIGGMKFFERAEVKNAVAYLRLIENPRSDTDLLRVVNVPARGIGNKTVERLLACATERGSSLFDAIEPLCRTNDLGSAAKKRLLAFHELIVLLRQLAEQQGPGQLVESVLEKSGYLAELQKTDSAEAEARIENLREFAASVVEFEDMQEALGQPATLTEYLERISLIADIDAAEDNGSVLLMTIHSAKGLEFDHVTIIGLEEEMLPYRGLDGRNVEELEEERRLLYVAITRARRELTLTHVGARQIFGTTRYGSRSRFLADLPEEAVQLEGQSIARTFSWGGSSQGSWGATRARPYPSPREPVRSARMPSEPADSDQYSWKRLHAAQHADEYAQDAPGADLDQSVPEDEPVIDYAAFDDAPALPRNLRIGARVVHERFGRGVIARVEVDARQIVLARFPGFGERRVQAASLRFE